MWDHWSGGAKKDLDLMIGCITDPSIRLAVTSTIKERISELERVLLDCKEIQKTGDHLKDHVLSYGERLAVPILEGALNDRGVEAKGFTSEDIGLISDGTPGKATADLNASKKNVMRVLEPMIVNDIIPIITGFYGCGRDGKTTCFGRNGSDYTTAVIASLMLADQVEIWKDVPGFMSADPGLIKSAKRIESLSYDEASELAYFGALIIHPRTVDPLVDAGIPLVIRDFSDPEQFTMVEKGIESGRGEVRSVSFTRNVGILKVKGPCVGCKPGILAEIALMVDRSCTNIRSVITSQSCIMIILDRDDLHRCNEMLRSQKMNSIEEIESISDLSLIGVVGEGIFERHGIASKVLQTVASKGINIEMISAGPSNVAYYFLVKEDDLSAAVNDDYIMEIVRRSQIEHEKRVEKMRSLKGSNEP